jgi:GxxExxY protein
MKSEDITRKIIAAAYRVYNTLGFGFLESVYKKAIIIELSKGDLKVEEEKPLKVYYDDHVVGDFYVDLFVEDEIVVELKSVQHLAKEHEVQLVNYLNGIKKDVGLLINFGPSGAQVKRKYRKPKTELVENPEGTVRQD